MLQVGDEPRSGVSTASEPIRSVRPGHPSEQAVTEQATVTEGLRKEEVDVDGANDPDRDRRN